jgi:hypothetical protein
MSAHHSCVSYAQIRTLSFRAINRFIAKQTRHLLCRVPAHIFRPRIVHPYRVCNRSVNVWRLPLLMSRTIEHIGKLAIR